MGLLMVISSLKSSLVPIIPLFSISVSLNIILTLMIVLRLALHGRHVRAAAGFGAGIGGLYKTIATMLIESCALFAVSSLLAVGSVATGSVEVSNLALPILTEIQVCAFPRPQSLDGLSHMTRNGQIIAPLLIIQRVANRSALSSTTIAGSIGSFRARSRGELTSGSGAFHGEHSMGPIGQRRTNSGEHGIGVESRLPSG